MLILQHKWISNSRYKVWKTVSTETVAKNPDCNSYQCKTPENIVKAFPPHFLLKASAAKYVNGRRPNSIGSAWAAKGAGAVARRNCASAGHIKLAREAVRAGS